ncbi:MAG TPA: ATP-binding protein [Bryobacteraceae bacterium]|jgi:signal transduction histidine kinase/DNA-binding response OmpR family regulator
MVRTLSAKYSVFTVVLVLWVVLVLLLFDTRREIPDRGRDALAGLILVIVSGLVARFTVRVIARPLANLRAAMNTARAGHLEKIRVSRTGDEIEYLGESFNQMIESLTAFQAELREQQQTLEDRIRLRTEELERATARALEANKAKSEFLANMSHELRTPMNGVLGMLDIALDSRLTPDQREHLETAQRCGFSLLDLLNDLLDLAKIESGKLVIERKPFDLPALLEETLHIHSSKASAKGLALTLTIEPGSPRRFEGDPARIRQMADNLLSNAVKFTDEGSIAVRVASEPSTDGSTMIQIDVLDTGPGIAPEKLPLIFESFTQADGSVSRKHGGTGLGLSLTRKLAELHGGSVTVESVLGEGSAFRLRFKCAVDPAMAVAKTSEPSESVSASGRRRILIVEDNIVNQKVIAAILKKGQYRTAIAEDGAQGLSMLENATNSKDAFSLVLMDIQMPVMDGLEATRRIRENPDWRHLPIIAMTAHAMNEDRDRCLEAGMNSYVLKPVTPPHLLQTIERFLNGSENGAKAAPQKAATATPTTTAQKAASEGLFQLFVEMAPERLSKIEAALSRQDRYALQQETRRLAAAAERIAATQVSTVARKIETVAPHEEFSELTTDLSALSAAIDVLRNLAGSPEHFDRSAVSAG